MQTDEFILLRRIIPDRNYRRARRKVYQTYPPPLHPTRDYPPHAFAKYVRGPKYFLAINRV